MLLVRVRRPLIRALIERVRPTSIRRSHLTRFIAVLGWSTIPKCEFEREQACKSQEDHLHESFPIRIATCLARLLLHLVEETSLGVKLNLGILFVLLVSPLLSFPLHLVHFALHLAPLLLEVGGPLVLGLLSPLVVILVVLILGFLPALFVEVLRAPLLLLSIVGLLA